MKRTASIAIGLLVAAAGAAGGRISYSYDSAGRLTAVDYGGGKASTFQYDPTGNLLRAADVVVVDSDNDGMADAWEMSYFGTLARDGKGDFDSDGMSDLAEYLAGTLPNQADSVLRMLATVTVTPASTEVSWEAVPGRTYRIQYKDSLDDVGWNDLPGDVTADSATASKLDTYTIGEAERFYRVQVVP